MSLTSDRIKGLREKHKLTQIEIAEKLGLSVSGYRKFEYGERDLNINLLRDIALFYNVSSDYLLGLSNISNDLDSKSFTITMAHNEMLMNEMKYESLKHDEGESTASTIAAYKRFNHSQGFYNKILYEYLSDFFEQPNPNPSEDRILRDKYPITFHIQEDLFLGVNVNVMFANGYGIESVKYYVGGYSLDKREAIEKAENYIMKMKKHLRLD